MYFEDYVPGRTEALGSVTLTEREIIDFAREHDPQPFHTDPDSAAAHRLGGVIASGLHTMVLAMRPYVKGYLCPETNFPGPGIDELRWHAPVRPGDRLTVRATVLDARPSGSKPDRGVVRTRLEVLGADDAVVLSMVVINIIRRRDAP
ncbi:MAG TPA: MaoC family dehydratase [Solirubrobacteraceae bacterium]|jgi:acyl dehydratase|nr:MaoC family dehydratase [Solirubrobacteraceae bacterium]